MNVAAALWLCAARASYTTRPASWRSSAGSEGHSGGDAATHVGEFLFSIYPFYYYVGNRRGLCVGKR
jgi:hypothetical protein